MYGREMNPANMRTGKVRGSMFSIKRSLGFRKTGGLFLLAGLLSNLSAAQRLASGETRDGGGKSQIIDARFENLMHQMTLEEKVRMLFGGEQPGVAQ